MPLTKVHPEPPRALEVAPTTQEMEREAPAPMCATDAEADEWAATWWTDYQPRIKAHTADLYVEPAELYKLLEERDGKPSPVKLLRLSWLLKRAAKLRRAKTDEERRALALPRRQVLEQQEPEAFLSVDEVRALGRGHAGDGWENCCPSAEVRAKKPLKVLSISHGEWARLALAPCGLRALAHRTQLTLRLASAGWLSPVHPDPRGQQLVRFAAQVRHERRMVRHCCLDVCCYPLCCGIGHGCCCFVVPCMGQQCGLRNNQLASGEFAIFYDYGRCEPPSPWPHMPLSPSTPTAPARLSLQEPVSITLARMAPHPNAKAL